MTMTQALNDSLEAQTRKHMEQWFWVHRRWKPARQARMAKERSRAGRGE
jgi:KDO2-lipid IV(A) lauroyltransferase